MSGPAPNNFIPTRARHDRYRLRSFSRQRKRRGEGRPTLVSYAADDPDRPNPLSFLGGELEVAWQTAVYDWEPGVPGSTRHAFPYLQLNPEAGGPGTQPAQWDFVRNAHSLIAPVDPASAGRGALNPRRAGGDLAARMWSVKTWQISGTYNGLTVDETVAAGNLLYVHLTDDVLTREETTVGGNAGQRGFLPVEGYIYYSRGEWDEERANIIIQFELPLAARYAASDDTQVWSTWTGSIFAGLGPAGEPMILPPFDVSVGWAAWNAENDATAGGYARASLLPTMGDLTRKPLPIILCGYQLTGFIQDELGGEIDPIEITAADFWPANAWPAP